MLRGIMGIAIYHVDAFTDVPFRGNPAAVCLLGQPAAEDWMQQVAGEMNLSETAFVHPEGASPDYRLRWFTPRVEVALCGHATLASAHVLWETRAVSGTDLIRFHTLSGVLPARRSGAAIELDFPSTRVDPADPPPGLIEAIGAKPRFVGRSRFDYLLHLDSAETLRNLKPDHARLAGLPVRGIIVTSRSDQPQYDFISRFFAPGSGVDEDPVTGSAHCALGPYWQPILNRSAFLAYQASVRGGVVRVRLSGDRVLLGGPAVTVCRGEWV